MDPASYLCRYSKISGAQSARASFRSLRIAGLPEAAETLPRHESPFKRASSHLICRADHLMCMMPLSSEIEKSDLAPFGMGVQSFNYSLSCQKSVTALLNKRAVPHERTQPLDTAWSDNPLQDYWQRPVSYYNTWLSGVPAGHAPIKGKDAAV